MDTDIILMIILGLLALYIMGVGIVTLFSMALEQGFIGLAVFIACWVFMWPVMIGVTAIVGLVFGIVLIYALVKRD